MQIKRDMSISHVDFFRTLPHAMRGNPYEVDGNLVRGTLPTGSLTISLGPEQVRKVGLFSFPRVDVIFDYDNVSDDDRITFMKYLDFCFMRGMG